MSHLLVVGDSGPHGVPFFQRVWSKVFDQCQVRGGIEARLATSKDSPLEDFEWLSGKASNLPPLLPKPFQSPAYRKREFSDALDQALFEYDVCAVLSAAPSSSTEVIIRALTASDVPLILAVDSTTLLYRQERLRSEGVNLSRLRPCVLQLVADNGQQASAIYAALQGIRTQHGNGQKVCVWAPDRTHPYVDDLCRQLRKRADTPSADLPLDINTRLEIERETLAAVYVGYSYEEVDQQMKTNSTLPFLIADGVARDKCHAWRDRIARTGETFFFQPTLLFEDCAALAYNACLEALEWRAAPARTYSESVRASLEEGHCRFTAEGANSSAGYAPLGYRELTT